MSANRMISDLIEELTEFIQSYNNRTHEFWDDFDEGLDHKLAYMGGIHDQFCNEITAGIKDILDCE